MTEVCPGCHGSRASKPWCFLGTLGKGFLEKVMFERGLNRYVGVRQWRKGAELQQRGVRITCGLAGWWATPLFRKVMKHTRADPTGRFRFYPTGHFACEDPFQRADILWPWFQCILSEKTHRGQRYGKCSDALKLTCTLWGPITSRHLKNSCTQQNMHCPPRSYK